LFAWITLEKKGKAGDVIEPIINVELIWVHFLFLLYWEEGG